MENSMKSVTGIFFISAGLLLLLTSLAKLISSLGAAPILHYPDPIFLLSFRTVFRMVGLIELFIAFQCLSGGNALLKAYLVFWMSAGFLAYRLGLAWMGYHRPCHCMGNLTDALGVPPDWADWAMKLILGYLFFGSNAILLFFWRKRKVMARLRQDDK